MAPGGPLVVGVAGGSGSGKTTLARELMSRLPDVEIISMDSYYKDQNHLSFREREVTNFDHPSAFEMSLLVKHLSELRAGREVEVPVYDFGTHARRTGYVMRVRPTRIIVVEGILLFVEPALRQLIDVKVFVDASADVRFIRRMRRDVAERGRSAEQVVEQYMSTVRSMHDAFVEPTKALADLVVPNDHVDQYAVATEVLVAFLLQSDDTSRRRTRAKV